MIGFRGIIFRRYNHQDTITKQISNSNIQNLILVVCLIIDYWLLFVSCNLVIGY